MGLLTAGSYLSRIRDELCGLDQPVAHPRLIGVLDRTVPPLVLIKRDAAAIATNSAAGPPAEHALESGVDLALETASYLYAAGAPTTQWRHWTALAGLGFVLRKRYAAACPYLVLGGEWGALEALRTVPAGRCSPASAALWQIAVAPGDPDELPVSDSFDRAWRDLVEAVPAADHGRVEEALTELATFWILESEGDWEFYHPRSAPDFEPEVCAVAAIAVRGGYRPRSLDTDVLRFLEPGLAEGFPEPLFPTWPFAEPVGA